LSGFSFSTPIHGREFDYTIRTVNFDSIHRVIININDHDRVLNTQEIPYEDKLSDAELMAFVKRKHEERVESLQEMMKISAKLESSPETDSNHKLGLVFLNNGLGREAVSEFKRALNLDSENAPILNHLGLALLLEKRYGEAVAVFKKALELKPNYPDIHNNFGMVYLQCENYPEALSEFEKALEINAGYAEAHFNIGLCLLSQAAVDTSLTGGHKPKIQNHLSRAVECNGYLNNEYFKVALNYLAKDQVGEARQALVETKTHLTNQNGSQVYHEFYLRLKYGEEGVDRKATEHYIAKLEEILEEHPNYVDIHNDLGVAYLIQCRFLFNRAIKEFKRSLAINTNFSQARKNLKLAENEGKGFLILLRAILYF
jgi:tetratricopeptide (TPR) repeat protein